MGALAVPQKLKYRPQDRHNRALCARVGVRLDGVTRPSDVAAYDVAEGWVQTTEGEVLQGRVEPFWR